ncbi:hypothetical protein K7432_013270 [Basidiobolus ranarum]|uniref:Zn(2)-C6 fungal-type domain-containing protein n=1 Tax=Basidiobolus ranarum TaxID=34480 RepID=A0ABR2WJG6_9FUNG
MLEGSNQNPSNSTSKETDEQLAYTYSPEALELVENFDAYSSFQFLADEHDLSLQEDFDENDIQSLLDRHQSEALELWNGSQLDETVLSVSDKADVVAKANKDISRKLQYTQRHEISGDILSIENELAIFENDFDTAEAADMVQSQQNDLMEHLESVKNPASSEIPMDYSSYKDGRKSSKTLQKSFLPPSDVRESERYPYEHGSSNSPHPPLVTLPPHLNYYTNSPAASVVDQFGNPYPRETQFSPGHHLQYEFLEREAQKEAYEMYAKQNYLNNSQSGYLSTPINMEHSMKAYMNHHSQARSADMNYYLQHFGESSEYDSSANHSPSELHPYVSLQHGDMKAWYAMGHHYHPYAPYPLHGYSQAEVSHSNSMGHSSHVAHLSKSGRHEEMTSKRAAKAQKKKNVGRACVHCKKAHLACDESRPCKRCVHLGKSFCVDVEHKRRGRPKLSTDKKNSSIAKESSYSIEAQNALLESL